MKIGYCRVSTRDQCLNSQRDVLLEAGCERIFEDVASGAQAERAALSGALRFARAGDVLVCTKLDRVARSLPHLISLMENLRTREIEFLSLSEDLNTSTAGGRLTFNLFGALAQFERDLIRERTLAGLQAARRRGKVGGRPRAITDDKLKSARQLIVSGQSVKEVASVIGVSTPTLYRYLKRDVPPPESHADSAQKEYQESTCSLGSS